jgi:hypothetical protein
VSVFAGLVHKLQAMVSATHGNATEVVATVAGRSIEAARPPNKPSGGLRT